MSDQSTSSALTLFHEADSLNTHNNEIVGFNEDSLMVLVCRPATPEFYDLVPLSPAEIKSVTIRLVFLPFNLIAGAVLAALGVGWFWGFIIGLIPVLFYVIAGGMVLVGLGMMVVCFETRAFFDTREGTQLLAKDVGESKQELREWLQSKSVSVI